MNITSKSPITFLAVIILTFFWGVLLASNSQKTDNFIDDSVITAEVKVSLINDEMISAFDINVKTQQGVVYLSGKVNTDMQYERVVTLAASINGVKNVDVSGLKIDDSNRNHPFRDTVITAKIKGYILKAKLFTNKDIQFWPIKIETHDGNVTLSGKVDNQKQKENIMDLVKSIEGVASIKDDIEVEKKRNAK